MVSGQLLAIRRSPETPITLTDDANQNLQYAVAGTADDAPRVIEPFALDLKLLAPCTLGDRLIAA